MCKCFLFYTSTMQIPLEFGINKYHRLICFPLPIFPRQIADSTLCSNQPQHRDGFPANQGTWHSHLQRSHYPDGIVLPVSISSECILAFTAFSLPAPLSVLSSSPSLCRCEVNAECHTQYSGCAVINSPEFLLASLLAASLWSSDAPLSPPIPITLCWHWPNFLATRSPSNSEPTAVTGWTAPQGPIRKLMGSFIACRFIAIFLFRIVSVS